MQTHNDLLSYSSTNDPAGAGNHTVPQWTAGTGTYTTNGTMVTGNGTSFTTEFKKRQSLFSSGKQECQQIESIQEDTVMWLRNPFTSDVAVAEAVKVVPRCSKNTIKVRALTGATVKVNNTVLAAGSDVEFNNNGALNYPYLDAVAVNVSAGTAEITTVE